MPNSSHATPPSDAERGSSSIAARAMGALRPSASSYLDGLNDEQRRAVEATEGPVLVLAGAGTGKTRVLTTRIAHLITTGRARPFDILSVTFTNKAAREMKHRIGTLIGPAGEGMPWLGTFHAIGTKILRRHAELVGLKSDFTILGTDDQLRLMKQVLKDQNIDEKRWPARALGHVIDGWKNRGLGPDQIPAGEAQAFAFGKGGDLYTAYQARLVTLNAVDFGDLLLLCLKLWRENPDVLANYQDRFRYILVDEYQDTNVAQYLWLRLLGQVRKNIACVGDDDQSIYGWRGAEVDNILRFEHDFPGAVVVRLERNYRSTGHILAAASGLIAKNQGRLGKTLRTEDELGEPVTVSGAWDSEEEARLLAESIEALQAKQHPLSEIAVLVRISAQMREIEDRFVQLGLPYRVIGGPRFYERAEIRDALAYLRATNNPSDDLAFERIVNTPKRGLGDATLQQLHLYARAEQVPLLHAARKLCETDELKPRVRSTLRALTESFSRWARLVESNPHSEVAQTILEESGYTEMWQKEKSADAAGRLENLKEFVRSMEEFPDMGAFLEHVSLVMEASEAEGAERVSLMTLHAAKGLEFDTVFLPGWEDGLFPNQRALDESGRAGLEEERRLAHVGLTRARKRAKLSFAVNRRIHGLWSSTIPSRFIDELPESAVDVIEAPAHFSAGASRFDRNPQPFGSSYGTPGWQRAQANTGQQNNFGKGAAHTTARGFGASPGGGRGGPRQIEGELIAKSTGTPSAFEAGMRVLHTKFGPGDVAAVDGNKLTVDFDKAGRKMVLDSFLQPA
ncbi:AAA family ATPase [Methylobacterium sp. WL30]|jgi:DNA helicase-2/ATP-dependent DNA helicase PcrA|uniref:ATP-dependent helicase n=1 Tax=unclassified Methylobacterium TaxID=2615210 RepID=UPI0011CC4FFA|nr:MULTISPECIES: UvrD-helicase domain-containing protein [unclassified Methylobacterium]MCJ2038342.1 UvrD-helicase domain-containing protein [Methylobacterium sp. J-059]TXN34550.1 AAA family ATPase [Methylobacterium sp. WL93]TXN45981.1 AAA family ATPase [Methylobacterium sp. WL119]TXN61753.1 AAA family ATPase [Methylobacterium sp. WL30]TXN64301.1 AAA family ATPase [Methylobacterium sp. WL6]